MLIFLLFSIVFKAIVSGGGANCLGEQCIKTQRRAVFKGTLTNSCTVCDIITMNMLKTSKLGLIS